MDGIVVIGETLRLIGEMLSILGPNGIPLFLLTLLLSALLSAFSPLSKITNYLAIVALVTLFAIKDADGLQGLPAELASVQGYLIVMLVPVAVVYGAKAALGRIGARSETEQLREAVTELTEQVAALRRDRQGENAEEDRGGIRGRYEALGEPRTEATPEQPAPEKQRPANLRLVRRR
ncbi:MAG: hypothetical protein AAGI89_03435 [Pseudomonadota bacterium]